MLKVLLWFVSKDMRYIQDAITILKIQNDGVEIVDKAAGEDISSLDKDFDVILVAGAKKIGMNKVTQAARQLNLPEEKLLGDWIACIPGFTLEKYRKLQRSRLSIFSKQCFGGCISKILGLPFRSPFVNLFLSGEDFIRFLSNPHFYLEKNPRFERLKDSSKEAPNGYPLLSLENISLNMMHYKEPDYAINKWNERKQRINWYNLIAITSTEDENILQEFDSLPYEKKVCFVPFKSNLDSAFYLNPKIDKKAKSFPDIVNSFGFGHVIYYDLFDMLLYGKKTPLIDM